MGNRYFVVRMSTIVINLKLIARNLGYKSSFYAFIIPVFIKSLASCTLFMRQELFGQWFTKLISLSGIAVLISSTVTALINQPSYAASVDFFCGKSNYQGKSVPATYARTHSGKEVLILRWISDDSFPPPWTAQRRCDEVSRRFQRSYDNGTLRYITTSHINKQSVVCAIANQSDACTDSNVLFTLKPGTKPSAVLARLLDRRGLAAGRVLNESGGDELTIDIDAYLQRVASEK